MSNLQEQKAREAAAQQEAIAASGTIALPGREETTKADGVMFATRWDGVKCIKGPKSLVTVGSEHFVEFVDNKTGNKVKAGPYRVAFTFAPDKTGIVVACAYKVSAAGVGKSVDQMTKAELIAYQAKREAELLARLEALEASK